MIEKKFFGTISSGQKIYAYTIKNKNMTVKISEYGAAVTSIIVPGRDGAQCDIVLGYDTPAEYEQQTSYIGSTLGRCCNRIANAAFCIDGHTVELTRNEKKHHLHGGRHGFNKKIWEAHTVSDNAVSLTYVSPDGEEGYPGQLTATVMYTVLEPAALQISYRAESDKDTVCGMSNHFYFNLAGYNSGTVVKQKIELSADYFSEDDSEFIPTGKILSVENTPLDLRKLLPIGNGLQSDYYQIKNANGYNVNYFIKNYSGELTHFASALADESGIQLDAFTTMPCFEFYTGSYLDGNAAGKCHVPIKNYYGFCLEPQFAPNAVNSDNLIKPLLKKGDIFTADTIYEFSHV